MRRDATGSAIFKRCLMMMGEPTSLQRSSEAADGPDDADRATFEEFFEAEKERLLRILSVITGSRSEAEDLAQESFARVYARWDSVASMGDPAGYLHRTSINLFRSQRRRAAVALRRAVALAPPPDVFEGVEHRDEAARALAELTPRQRAALVLTEVLGFSGEETGRLLGIRASTVWALTHQARTVLRQPGGPDE
jgi:RNA polymerase sigma factor (sigma-70 family)